jgi:hypothetical protein
LFFEDMHPIKRVHVLSQGHPPDAGQDLAVLHIAAELADHSINAEGKMGEGEGTDPEGHHTKREETIWLTRSVR